MPGVVANLGVFLFVSSSSPGVTFKMVIRIDVYQLVSDLIQHSDALPFPTNLKRIPL